MKRVIMLACGIVLFAGFAYATDRSRHPGETSMQWLDRVQREDRQEELERSQIRYNNEMANRARQNQNKKKYEIKQRGNKFIIEED